MTTKVMENEVYLIKHTGYSQYRPTLHGPSWFYRMKNWKKQYLI